MMHNDHLINDPDVLQVMRHNGGYIARCLDPQSGEQDIGAGPTINAAIEDARLTLSMLRLPNLNRIN